MSQETEEKKRILIVEDDPDMQLYFRIILSERNLELLQAENGAEALAVLDSGQSVDLILLDMVMPVMSGEEFFRILRLERKSDVPVIFCSVDDSRAAPLETIGTLQGIFVKGKKSRDLKALIERNLRRHTTPQ